MSVQSKIGKRIVDNGTDKVRLTPLEDALSLVSMLQINLQGRSVGAYVLRKGANNFMIHFGFECAGIHSTLRNEQISPVFDAIESGLKDLPEGERLTIHLSSFTNDTNRQQQLKNLSDNAPNLGIFEVICTQCRGLNNLESIELSSIFASIVYVVAAIS